MHRFSVQVLRRNWNNVESDRVKFSCFQCWSAPQLQFSHFLNWLFLIIGPIKPFLVGSFSGEVLFWWGPFLMGSFSGGVLFWLGPFLARSFSGEVLFWWGPFLMGSFSGGVLFWLGPFLARSTDYGPKLSHYHPCDKIRKQIITLINDQMCVHPFKVTCSVRWALHVQLDILVCCLSLPVSCYPLCASFVYMYQGPFEHQSPYTYYLVAGSFCVL